MSAALTELRRQQQDVAAAVEGMTELLADLGKTGDDLADKGIILHKKAAKATVSSASQKVEEALPRLRRLIAQAQNTHAAPGRRWAMRIPMPRSRSKP